MVKFYQFFRRVLLKIHFGSGAAQIRNDSFWIWIQNLLKVSDPSGSGSTTLLSSVTISFCICDIGLCLVYETCASTMNRYPERIIFIS
jgi:hypothetical protein